MKPYFRCPIILVILVLFVPAKSQIPAFNNSFAEGKVIDDSTGQNVAFVHIFNESSQLGFIGNEKGEFRIPAKAGDTLVYSALGYFAKVQFITAEDFKPGHIVKLTPRVYEIEEVRVRLFKDYDDFRRQFLALELPETSADRLRNNLTTQSRTAAKKAEYERQVKEILERPGIQLFSATIPILSREEKQLRNYAEIQKKEEHQRIIEKKYNRDIIHEITHLSEDEITEFMGFCNFDEEFLFEASEYEILVKIEDKFKEYRLWKENGSLHDEEVKNRNEYIS